MNLVNTSLVNCHIGRAALTNFFFSLSSQKAHWYLIILPTEIDDDYNLLRSTFPPLSYLLNLEEQLVRKVLLESRLLKRNSRAKANGLVSPIYQLWEDYIRENGVDIEWSMCKIGGKARFFVQIAVSNGWFQFVPMFIDPLLQIKGV